MTRAQDSKGAAGRDASPPASPAAPAEADGLRVGDVVFVEGEGEMEVTGFDPGCFRSVKVRAVRVVELDVNPSIVRRVRAEKRRP